MSAAAPANETWTITFSECVENHAGMAKHGEIADTGFTREEVANAYYHAKNKKYKVEFYDLRSLLNGIDAKDKPEMEDSACLLVIRNGIDLLLEDTKHQNTDFNKEIESTKDRVDKKALMRGKVVNKHARWNLCYADEGQKADIANGQGTIIPFGDSPILRSIRDGLNKIFGDKASNLFAELNYYYDITKCGIGFHGDSERRRIIAVRIGEMLPLYYQWYYKSQRIGEMIKIEINGGDVYMMGEKAAGTDWKKRNVATLRHAAGFHKKYLEAAKKKE